MTLFQTRMLRTSVCVLALGLSAYVAAGQKQAIDVSHSVLTINVGKEGAFSAFGHNHTISAPIESGDAATSDPQSVEFTVKSAEMKVEDTDISDSTRAEIQATMLSSQVLDATKYPEIHFQSQSVERKSDTDWLVHGSLTLHGVTKSIVVETQSSGGHYRGTASLLQTDYGITPVKVGGGAVKVKNEIQIAFDVMLMNGPLSAK